MIAEQRIYRTTGGELVIEGDARAAFLAYPAGEVVADRDTDAYQALIGGPKRRPKPGDKAATPPGLK